MSACKRCSDPIRFVTNTETGKRIPVDPVPDESGNVLAKAQQIRATTGEVTGTELVGHPRRKGEETPPGWALYMPHYATCRARIQRGRGTPRPQTLFDRIETEER